MATLTERLALRERRTADPCWCDGPWSDVEPEFRPEDKLAHEHERGTRGCWYPPRRRFTPRDMTRSAY